MRFFGTVWVKLDWCNSGSGTPFAFVRAVAYLYLQGNTVGALGLAVVGIAHYDIRP